MKKDEIDVYIITNDKKPSNMVLNFLRKYMKYKIHTIPTVFNEFDVFKYEPDIVIVGNEMDHVIKCYEWKQKVEAA